jgi:hypothetical protein
MTQQFKGRSNDVDADELLHMFGAIPVLSSESTRSYREIMVQLLEAFAPRDFMGQVLIKELTDSTWEMMRYTRHKTLGMNRRFAPRLAFQEQRRKAQAHHLRRRACLWAGNNHDVPQPERPKRPHRSRNEPHAPTCSAQIPHKPQNSAARTGYNYAAQSSALPRY